MEGLIPPVAPAVVLSVLAGAFYTCMYVVIRGSIGKHLPLTLVAAIVGAFVVLAMLNYMTPFGSWVTVIQGVVFILCVLMFRDGIVGELRNWWQRRQGPRRGI